VGARLSREEKLSVEDTVSAQIQESDPLRRLRGGDFQHVLFEVMDAVMRCMDDEKRTELEEDDHTFIARRVRMMVHAALEQYDAEGPPPTRFRRLDHVVCNVGGERKWASGVVAATNEDDPADPSSQSKLPYVVEIDPPSGRFIAVPKDDYDLIRAEVCFGQRGSALWFTLCSMPEGPPAAAAAAPRRFGVGDRVACAIEDDTNDHGAWGAGTVLDVDYSVEGDATALLLQREWGGDAGIMPYRVQLDGGRKVLVHRDEHWLVRELALQPEGPRQEEHNHQEEFGHVELCCHEHGHCDHEHGHSESCAHEHDHAPAQGHGHQDHVQHHVHAH